MAPLFLWTAVLAVIASLGSVGVSAMPMLTEQGDARLTIPSPLLEFMQQYVQQRDLQLREAEQAQADQPQAQPLQLQPSELRQQFKQWIDMQLARLPAAAAGEAEEPSKALVPQQPKRGNYMALCHFKICNMGRKRSPRIQPQDLP